MNPRTQKLRAELEKNTEKISKLQARNTEIKSKYRNRRICRSWGWCGNGA